MRMWCDGRDGGMRVREGEVRVKRERERLG